MDNKPKAVLITPPIYDFALYDLFLKPYGLLKIGALLQASGWEITFINALDYKDEYSSKILGRPRRSRNGTGKFHREVIDNPAKLKIISRKYGRYGIAKDKYEEILKTTKGDAFFISSGMTYWYKGIEETSSILKKYHKNVPIVIGGIYSSLMPEHCRKTSCADFIGDGNSLESLKVFLNNRGLPFTLSPDNIHPLMLKQAWADSAVFKLNNGCPMSCKYCASKKISGAFKKGDPNSSFSLYKQYKKEFNTKYFAFYDDALLVGKDDVLVPFLEMVSETGEKNEFYLPNAIHINSFDYNIARLMKSAGFKELRFGFESSSSDFHENNDGKFIEQSFLKALDAGKSAGFKSSEIGLYVLAGLPGQEVEEVNETLKYCMQFDIKIFIAEYSPVPGTEMWEECLKLCRLPIGEDPFYHNNTLFPMEWEKFSMDDLNKIKQKAAEHNLRIKYLPT